MKAIERPPGRVWLMRVAFALAIVGMIGGWAGGLYCGFIEFIPGFVVGCLIAFPCILFVVLTGLSCSVFYFDYSLLGKRMPAAPPMDWQCVATTVSGIAIDVGFQATAPLVHWRIGPGGVQVRVLYYPPVFIASQQFISITKDSWGSCRIDHTSSEIRSPFKVPEHVVEAMHTSMPEIAKFWR